MLQIQVKWYPPFLYFAPPLPLLITLSTNNLLKKEKTKSKRKNEKKTRPLQAVIKKKIKSRLQAATNLIFPARKRKLSTSCYTEKIPNTHVKYEATPKLPWSRDRLRRLHCACAPPGLDPLIPTLCPVGQNTSPNHHVFDCSAFQCSSLYKRNLLAWNLVFNPLKCAKSYSTLSTTPLQQRAMPPPLPPPLLLLSLL